MKILPTWLREFVDIPADDRRLADDLTNAGISVEAIAGEAPQTAYEVEITTNRPDAMNHYGVARDCAAIYDRELKPLSPRLQGASTRPPAFTIEIEAPEMCARYTARIIRGVSISPSPAPMAQRLELLDARPINNVADASNYTLQEMGHPTHCFDLDLLQGGKIVVRRARQGETLRTLDGVERKLTSEDLVIADAVRSVALAGVMGGFDTMITEKTRNVLIESAWFDPAAIRRTSRRHGMHTDASHRFERGADVGATSLACARVAEIILQTAGGQLDGGEIDAFPRPIQRPQLRLRHSEVLRILGQDMPSAEITRILRRLGFVLAASDGQSEITVTLPTWRLDVEREVDLIEEIARIYGYDRFPNTLPGFAGGLVELPDAPKEEKVRSTLLALGYSEAMSLAFVSREDAATFSDRQPVEIANPLNAEARFMRTSLVPGMLEMLAWNLNRGCTDARLFETGHIYERLGDRAAEYRRLCVGSTGNAAEATVHHPARPYTFFDLKGDGEALLSAFEHRGMYCDEFVPDYYHPGRAARAVLDGMTVALFGQLHPRLQSARKLRQEVYVAEFDLDRLFRHPLRQPRYREIPPYPAVLRDFSFIFEDSVRFENIEAAIVGLKNPEMRALRPVEIFRGGAVPTGRYSLLLRVTFQSPRRTLRDEEVMLWSQRIIEALQGLGGTLRA